MIEMIRQGLSRIGAIGWPAGLALGVAAFSLSLVVGVVVVVALPADHFVRGPAKRGFFRSHPAARLTLLAAKNLLGAVLFVVGLVMAVPLVPGPGALFVLLGLSLVDFPGKRSLQKRILRVPRVLASVNRMRARFGKPPILTGE